MGLFSRRRCCSLVQLNIPDVNGVLRSAGGPPQPSDSTGWGMAPPHTPATAAGLGLLPVASFLVPSAANRAQTPLSQMFSSLQTSISTTQQPEPNVNAIVQPAVLKRSRHAEHIYSLTHHSTVPCCPLCFSSQPFTLRSASPLTSAWLLLD